MSDNKQEQNSEKEQYIRERAYFLHKERETKNIEGDEITDWLKAEEEFQGNKKVAKKRAAKKKPAAKKRAAKKK